MNYANRLIHKRSNHAAPKTAVGSNYRYERVTVVLLRWTARAATATSACACLCVVRVCEMTSPVLSFKLIWFFWMHVFFSPNHRKQRLASIAQLSLERGLGAGGSGGNRGNHPAGLSGIRDALGFLLPSSSHLVVIRTRFITCHLVKTNSYKKRLALHRPEPSLEGGRRRSRNAKQSPINGSLQHAKQSGSSSSSSPSVVVSAIVASLSVFFQVFSP